MCVFVGLGKGSLEILKCMFLVPPTGTLLLPVTNSSSCCCCSRLKLFTISQKFLKKQSKQYHVPPVIIILYHIWRFHNNCEAILCNYRPLAAPLRTTWLSCQSSCTHRNQQLLWVPQCQIPGSHIPIFQSPRDETADVHCVWEDDHHKLCIALIPVVLSWWWQLLLNSPLVLWNCRCCESHHRMSWIAWLWIREAGGLHRDQQILEMFKCYAIYHCFQSIKPLWMYAFCVCRPGVNHTVRVYIACMSGS